MQWHLQKTTKQGLEINKADYGEGAINTTIGLLFDVSSRAYGPLMSEWAF